MTRLWTWLFRLGALAGAAPLFASRHLPFADLPEHVAVIATLRHYWDPAWRTQELFTIEGAWRTQYWLYDVVGAALAFFMGGAERANLVLLALTALGFSYGLRALLRAFRHDERLGLLGVPLFWNRALAEGLLSFVAAIPVLLYGLALVADHAREPTRRRAKLLAAFALALFFLHLSAFVVFVVAAAVVDLGWLEDGAIGTLRSRLTARLKGAPKRALWLVPVLFAVVLFAATSPVTHPDAAQGAHAKIVRFYPNAMLLRALPGWMADFWKTRADDAAALLAALAVAVTFVPWPGSASPEGRRARWLGRSLVLVAAAFYFAMPSQVGFAFILDLRLAPIVGLFAVLLARRVQGRLADASAALALTGALATSAVGLSEMRAYETEEAARLDILLKRLPAGKRLLSLVFDPASRHAIIPPFVHAGAYYRARYGGIASFSFSELPHWPVRYRPEAAPPKKHVVFWDYAPCLFRNTEDGPQYDFVLVRGDVDPFESDPPGPVYRPVAIAREWKLFARTADPPRQAPEGFVDRGPCAAAQDAAREQVEELDGAPTGAPPDAPRSP